MNKTLNNSRKTDSAAGKDEWTTPERKETQPRRWDVHRSEPIAFGMLISKAIVFAAKRRRCTNNNDLQKLLDIGSSFL